MSLLRVSNNIVRPFLSRSLSYVSSPLTNPLTLPVVEVAPPPPPPSEVTVSRLKDGVTVVTNSHFTPISRISICVPAGSRYQTEGDVGVAHFLRHNTFLTNSERTGFRVTRELELVGASLHADMTRDLLVLSSAFSSGLDECVLENLTSVYSYPAFSPWEVSNERVLLDLDRLHVHPETVVDEEIHRLSYRTGLGMPMFTPECRAALITHTQIKDFYNSRVNAENTVIVGSGIVHREFVSLVEDLLIPPVRSVSPREPPKYYGGAESHVRLYGEQTTAMMAVEGVSAGSEELTKYLVLKHLLGGESKVKRSDQSFSRFGQCLSQFKGCSIAPVCISHVDSGLFGMVATAPSDRIRRLVEKGLGVFRDVARVGIAPHELKAAKARAKSEVLSQSDGVESSHSSLTLQVSMTGGYTSPHELVDRIDRITSEDIQNVARKVNTSKPNLVVAGNLSDPPYLDGLV